MYRKKSSPGKIPWTTWCSPKWFTKPWSPLIHKIYERRGFGGLLSFGVRWRWENHKRRHKVLEVESSDVLRSG
jgi:hypothetical protein